MTRLVVNPLALFLAVWATAVTLYLGGVYAGTFPSPQPVFWTAVLLSVGGLSAGYFTWATFARGLPLPVSAASPERVLTPPRIVRLLWLTGATGLIALALALYRLTVIASSLGVSVRDLLGDPGLVRAGFAGFVTTGVFETNWIVMLNSVTSALFSTGFVLLGILLCLDARRRKYFYLVGFLTITVGTGLTSVSRYEATVNVLYLVFAYCVVRSSCGARPVSCGGPVRAAVTHPAVRSGRRRRALFSIFIALTAVVALFAAIDVLLDKSTQYDQPNLLRGFAFQVYWYIASPLAALNELLATFDGHHHLGQYTFFPFYKWLLRLHLASEADISVFGEFIFVPYVANVYTWLRNFYEDFGLPGVAVAPYLLGAAAAALRTRAGAYFPYLNLYVILLVFLLFSFYNYFLFSNQVYLQALFGFVLLRYRLSAWDN